MLRLSCTVESLIQTPTRDTLLKAKYLVEKTKQENLCLSGGKVFISRKRCKT